MTARLQGTHSVAGMTPAQVRELCSMGNVVRRDAGTDLRASDGFGTKTIVVLRGTVRVVPKRGRASLLHGGDVMGNLTALNPAAKSTAITAASDVEFVVFDRLPLGAILMHFPALGEQVTGRAIAI